LDYKYLETSSEVRGQGWWRLSMRRRRISLASESALVCLDQFVVGDHLVVIA
jgi:hypothetical protein